MPGLYKPHAGGYIDSRLAEIERRIQEDDPRLYMRVGYITDQFGRKVDERAEVRRHNEDGTDTEIGAWMPSEVGQIPTELRMMRLGVAGHESVLDRIDRHNAALERSRGTAFRESYGEMLEHFSALVHDRTQPRNTFYQVGGRRDDKK